MPQPPPPSSEQTPTQAPKSHWLLITIAVVVGIPFVFLGETMQGLVKSSLGITIRVNDFDIIGILLLIIAAVLIYRWLVLKNQQV